MFFQNIFGIYASLRNARCFILALYLWMGILYLFLFFDICYLHIILDYYVFSIQWIIEVAMWFVISNCNVTIFPWFQTGLIAVAINLKKFIIEYI